MIVSGPLNIHELYDFLRLNIYYIRQILEYLYILVSEELKTVRTTANGTTVLSAFSNQSQLLEKLNLNHHEVTNDVYALKIQFVLEYQHKYEDILLHDLIFMRYLL